MIVINRSEDNPILSPIKESPWEAEAAFNGCPCKDGNQYHLVYRALSSQTDYLDKNLKLSTIGYACGTDGVHFSQRRQLIKPGSQWDQYGCEDPRITKLGDTYYIFYTALSSFPPNPYGIKVGLAKSKDISHFSEKHLITNFNAKAMALFPEKINGKYFVILTANTDFPPSKIGIASFEKEEDMWSEDFWSKWYAGLNNRIIPLSRNVNDQIEVGSPPVKTAKGWLVFYSHIQNYYSQSRVFGIEAVLLDLVNPQIIVGKTERPLFVPEKYYEFYGQVPNIVFPCGAVINQDTVSIYYGASDTFCCVATTPLEPLLAEIVKPRLPVEKITHPEIVKLTRFADNPIIQPIPANDWESKYTFNPGAIYEGNKVHLLYRAIGVDDISTLGYAVSADGLHIDKRSPDPVYIPRKNFELKVQPGNSGCEDARITKLNERMYIFYTAFDAKNPPRVAMSSISVENFLKNLWEWDRPKLISPPGIDDKDACLFPEKINGRYVFFHRFDPCIWIDFTDSLEFPENRWLRGRILFEPRSDKWDSEKIGIGPPPIKTDAGWFLIYHGISSHDKKYRLGAALLDLEDPSEIIARLDSPILEPEVFYENNGLRPGTVFCNGAVVIGETLYVYYGGADQFTAVATTNFNALLEKLKK